MAAHAAAAVLIAGLSLVVQPQPSNQPATRPAGGAGGGAVRAPQSPTIGETRAAMRKLSWLAGRWEGTATVAPQGGRPIPPVRQDEWVEYKVEGTAMLVEGRGSLRGPGGEAGQVIFRALATITYDPPSQKYVMRAHTEMGHVEPRVEVGDREMTWSFTAGPPGGERHIRYHIRLDEQGRWHETGETSTDGGRTWSPLIELVLTRVGDVPERE